ncbi:MAG TPA: hypothetical protein VMF88_00855 [Bacteroidota bacterium]|nr:hypothetical protein [Bacteroidota bacterium]
MIPKIRLPQPREVWSAIDKDIKLHDTKRVFKGPRFVLVVMLRDLVEDHESIFNIIPLSASAKPDRLTFPIHKGYEDIAQGFNPKESSCAVVNFYQPFEFPSFKHYKGRIDETTYEAIKTLLCKEVIGYNDLDYSI